MQVRSIFFCSLLLLSACGGAASDATPKPPAQFFDEKDAVLLDAIRTATPDIPWGDTDRGYYPEVIMFDIDAGIEIKEYVLTGTVMAASVKTLSDYREKLDAAVRLDGWTPYLNLDADGVDGSIWGYQKPHGEDGAIRLLIFSWRAKCTPADDGEEPNFDCKNPRSEVFLTDAFGVAK